MRKPSTSSNWSAFGVVATVCVGSFLVVCFTITLASSIVQRYEDQRFGGFRTFAYDDGSGAGQRQLLGYFPDDTPRYNANGKQIDKKFDPTNQDYWISLVIMLIPGIVIGILSCFCCCCFFCLRLCCNTCGGTEPKEDGYSTLERWIPKLGIYIVGGVTIACAIAGWVGDGKVSAGLNGFVDVIDNVTESAAKTGEDIQELLLQVQSTDVSEVIDAVASFQDGVDDVRSVTKNVKSVMKQIDSGRNSFILASYIIASLATIAGAAGAFLNGGKLCLLMAVGGFLSLFLLWISFGIHLPVSVLLADICDSIHDYVDGNSSDNSTEELIPCISNSSTDGLLDISNTGIQDSLDAINNVTLACCNVTFGLNNLSNIDSYPFPNGTDLSTLRATVNDISIFFKVLALLQPYLDCSFARDTFNALRGKLCDDTLSGTSTIMVTQGITGIILVPGVILAIIAWKRVGNPKGSSNNYTFRGTQDPENMEMQMVHGQHHDHHHDNRKSHDHEKHKSKHKSHDERHHDVQVQPVQQQQPHYHTPQPDPVVYPSYDHPVSDPENPGFMHQAPPAYVSPPPQSPVVPIYQTQDPQMMYAMPHQDPVPSYTPAPYDMPTQDNNGEVQDLQRQLNNLLDNEHK